nr:MAG TPA: Putative metallopeptidase domain protein [Caudoviricetes sp.]
MLYKLNYVEDLHTPSMHYDGANSCIHLNPKWFESLSDQEACSALAHEALHYALQHDIRKGNRNPELYNKAADHVVNNILMDYGFELPADVPVDRRYQNKTTEYVYKLMEEEQKDKDQQNDPDQSPFGSDIQFSTPTAQQQSKRDRETLAANQNDESTLGKGKGIGTESETFSELFKNILDGKQSWRDILLEYVNEKSQGDRDWQNLDRRMLQLGYYMPDTKTDNRIDRIAVAIDISGSVTYDQLDYFLRETKTIKNNTNPKVLDVVSFNTEITGLFSFEEDDSFDDLNIEIDGGTSLDPVWNHYGKTENKPTFLIVFSDMYVSIPPKPDYEIIWCVVDNPKWKPPYGKAIYINEEDYGA